MKVVKFKSSNITPYPLQIVGEQSYRFNIEAVAGIHGDEGVNDDGFTARLILENNNLQDPNNAVVVTIDNKTVGYLNRSDARKYRSKLVELKVPDAVGECYASIKGGFLKRDQVTIADYGVRLDIDLSTLSLRSDNPAPRQTQTQPPSIKQNEIQTNNPADVPGSSRQQPKRKIPLIPIKGKGVLYYLLVFPFVLTINFSIILLFGMLIGIEWLVSLFKKS